MQEITMPLRQQIKRETGELTDSVGWLEMTVYGHDLSADEKVVPSFETTPQKLLRAFLQLSSFSLRTKWKNRIAIVFIYRNPRTHLNYKRYFIKLEKFKERVNKAYDKLNYKKIQN